jgi:hypothetical protein
LKTSPQRRPEKKKRLQKRGTSPIFPLDENLWPFFVQNKNAPKEKNQKHPETALAASLQSYSFQ